jgi:hypothetical protein
MFRVLQTLEREPQEDFTGTQIYDASPAPGRPPFVSIQIYDASPAPGRPPFVSMQDPRRYIITVFLPFYRRMVIRIPR